MRLEAACRAFFIFGAALLVQVGCATLPELDLERPDLARQSRQMQKSLTAQSRVHQLDADEWEEHLRITESRRLLAPRAVSLRGPRTEAGWSRQTLSRAELNARAKEKLSYYQPVSAQNLEGLQ